MSRLELYPDGTVAILDTAEDIDGQEDEELYRRRWGWIESITDEGEEIGQPPPFSLAEIREWRQLRVSVEPTSVEHVWMKLGQCARCYERRGNMDGVSAGAFCPGSPRGIIIDAPVVFAGAP